MKKVLFALALFSIFQLGFAQQAASKADVMKLINLSGSDASMKVAKEQILKMIPTDKQGEFLKEFDATLPSLYDSLANIYIEMYSEKDIKEMIAFYESPIGKKINGNMGDFTKKMMGASKEWGGSLQGIMMKYMKQ
ncbi:DUF2059 domain-containing protein [Flavobacterium sp. WC2421]|jgi:uncharacterized protein|uniref:DUF2059 domain-containing protein n=3 Tax=unclassified Flavobacterium TaxID=196869 RepID=A0AB39WDI2_9FLAO